MKKSSIIALALTAAAVGGIMFFKFSVSSEKAQLIKAYENTCSEIAGEISGFYKVYDSLTGSVRFQNAPWQAQYTLNPTRLDANILAGDNYMSGCDIRGDLRFDGKNQGLECKNSFFYKDKQKLYLNFNLKNQDLSFVSDAFTGGIVCSVNTQTFYTDLAQSGFGKLFPSVSKKQGGVDFWAFKSDFLKAENVQTISKAISAAKKLLTKMDFAYEKADDGTLIYTAVIYKDKLRPIINFVSGNDTLLKALDNMGIDSEKMLSAVQGAYSSLDGDVTVVFKVKNALISLAQADYSYEGKAQKWVFQYDKTEKQIVLSHDTDGASQFVYRLHIDNKSETAAELSTQYSAHGEENGALWLDIDSAQRHISTEALLKDSDKTLSLAAEGTLSPSAEANQLSADLSKLYFYMDTPSGHFDITADGLLVLSDCEPFSVDTSGTQILKLSKTQGAQTALDIGAGIAKWTLGLLFD